MKKNILKRIITVAITGTLFAGVLTGCGNANSAGGDVAEANITNSDVTIIYAATGANPRPFTYQDENGELKGHNIELIEAVFERLPQYELVWEVTDFPSIFTGLDSGRYQLGVNNLSKNPDREEKYIFTDAMFENEIIIVAGNNVDLFEGITLADLAGLKYIGAPAITYTTEVETYNEANPNATIDITYTDADLSIQLEQVASGAADFTLIDAPMYYGYYQPEFGFDLNTITVEKSDDDTDSFYSYFVVSKENEQLVSDINAALYEVIADGTSKEINEKYFGKDYSPALEALTGK